MSVTIRQAGNEWLIDVKGEPIGTASTEAEAQELAGPVNGVPSGLILASAPVRRPRDIFNSNKMRANLHFDFKPNLQFSFAFYASYTKVLRV